MEQVTLFFCEPNEKSLREKVDQWAKDNPGMEIVERNVTCYKGKLIVILWYTKIIMPSMNDYPS